MPTPERRPATELAELGRACLVFYVFYSVVVRSAEEGAQLQLLHAVGGEELLGLR